MAGIKISQLISGGTVSAPDEIPIARGNETYKVSLRQFVTTGQNIGDGTAQIYAGEVESSSTTLQFRSIKGAEGISVENDGSSIVIATSGQNPVKTRFFGDGSTKVFSISGANSINPNNYRVDIDGVLQEANIDYFINGSQVTFTDAPGLSSKVVVVSNNLVRAIDTSSTVIISDTPPENPSLGTLWYDSSAGDCSIYYNDGDSFQWVDVAGSNTPSVAVSDTPPSNAIGGSLWYNSSNGVFAVYYDDGTSTQWIDVGGSSSGDDNSPIGSVMFFAASAAPLGWFECKGQTLDKVSYLDLFNVIGYTYGGSGNSFNLPDLRGEFLRGWDNGRGIDSGRAFGSSQLDEFKSHSHSGSVSINGGTTSGSNFFTASTPGITPRAGNGVTNTLTINLTGGSETRPRNIALLPCIKYTSAQSLNTLGLSAQSILDSVNTLTDTLNTSLSTGTTVAKAWINFDGFYTAGAQIGISSNTISCLTNSTTGTFIGSGWTGFHVGVIYKITQINGISNATLGGVDVSTSGIQIVSVESASSATFKFLSGVSSSAQTVTGTGSNLSGFSWVVYGIRSSYNISSITRTAAGYYTINFLNPMVDANYALVATSSNYSGSDAYLVYEGDNTNLAATRTRSFVKISCGTVSAAANSHSMNVVIFGN